MEFLSYRKPLPRSVWPKVPPVLTPLQLDAREKYMMLWHQELPKKYGIVEDFNHGFIAALPIQKGWKTLEIGAGLGSHIPYEDLSTQDYHCLEYREEFCKEIRKILPLDQVWCGDIQAPDSWPSRNSVQSFDRIIAIHVLEHLVNLPVALGEIQKLLKPQGVLDIVVPCEGGLAHTFARKISAERLFLKNFKMDFAPIHLNEHVNSFDEVYELVQKRFEIVSSNYFPLRVPFQNMNICVGFRLRQLV
jgi:SAM-dependent methyltransferase